MIVTPGFVDVHTHLDAQITWDPLGSPSNLHGVTSVVVGNCGVGFAPCKPQDRDYLMFLMEGVEDIPQAAMKAGLRWDWETFPEYLDALARQPLGLNVGAHISHAPLRIYVMGGTRRHRHAGHRRRARGMRAAVRRRDARRRPRLRHRPHDMHRTPAWDPVPGTFADRRELDALAGALADSGTGVFELVPYGGGGEDVRGFDRSSSGWSPSRRACGRPISISPDPEPRLSRSVARRARTVPNAPRRRGARIVPQVAVRSVGVLLGFGTSLSPALALSRPPPI